MKSINQYGVELTGSFEGFQPLVQSRSGLINVSQFQREVSDYSKKKLWVDLNSFSYTPRGEYRAAKFEHFLHGSNLIAVEATRTISMFLMNGHHQERITELCFKSSVDCLLKEYQRQKVREECQVYRNMIHDKPGEKKRSTLENRLEKLMVMAEAFTERQAAHKNSGGEDARRHYEHLFPFKNYGFYSGHLERLSAQINNEV